MDADLTGMPAEAFGVFKSVRRGPAYGASVSVSQEAKQAAARNKLDREKTRLWCAVYTAIAMRACK